MLVANPAAKKNHSGNLRVFVMVILDQILKKENGVTEYSGFMWLRIGAGELRVQGMEVFDSLNNYKRVLTSFVSCSSRKRLVGILSEF